MTVGEDLLAPDDGAGATAASGGERESYEGRRSRRRRFVAATRHDQGDATAEADIPVLSEIVLPEAFATTPHEATHEPLAGQRAELAAELVDTLRQRLADRLPMLVATSMAETAGRLHQAIESMIATAVKDFSAAHETLSSMRAQAATDSADAATAGSAGDPERSPDPV